LLGGGGVGGARVVGALYGGARCMQTRQLGNRLGLGVRFFKHS
jgi:hypothetical protein